MSASKKTWQAALISGASIILAGITLLSLRVLHPSWQSDQLVALLLSLAFCVGACFLLFLRRLGQAHMALGVYLLVIGGAMVVLPRLLMAGFGGNDLDLQFLLLGPVYLFAGMVLVAASLLNHKYWMESSKTMWMRTILLAGPGVVLSILCPIALGPHLWDVPPYGFDLVAASWVLGIGIFVAGAGSPHQSELVFIKGPLLAALTKLQRSRLPCLIPQAQDEAIYHLIPVHKKARSCLPMLASPYMLVQPMRGTWST